MHSLNFMTPTRRECAVKKINNPIQLVAKISITLSGLGIIAWFFLRANPDFLPAPTTKIGRQILRQYQGAVADIFLGLIIATITYLLFKIISSQKQEAKTASASYPTRKESFFDFAKQHPLTLAIMAAYLTAMIAGTTHLYRDLIGWYPNLIENDLLGNFSIRSSFISETFRRADFRFFPLAHQDLHVLSWFTVHVKAWMIYTGAQLFAITILATRLAERLTGSFSKKESRLLLIITLLLLFHPSTGNTFFHVIYCERTLALLALIYFHCLLEHRATKTDSSFYKALLIAVLGIFTKDIAAIIFLTPPALQLASNLYHKRSKENKNFWKENKLEISLLSLTPVFITCFVYMALIPSSYANQGVYGEPTGFSFSTDARILILLSMLAIKLGCTRQSPLRPDLLDQINISAVLYAGALGSLAKYDSSDYLTFPIQAIIVINIGWILSKRPSYLTATKSFGIKNIPAGALTAFTVITAEQFLISPSFYTIVAQMKKTQLSTQSTYSALFPEARSIRENGEEVNVIIHRSSRLSYHRHLHKIPYDRLIEYHPTTMQYIIKDGNGKGGLHAPSKGDLVVNIDKGVEILSPILEGRNFDTLYRHNVSTNTGLIIRLR
jgi:hypothetical protein